MLVDASRARQVHKGSLRGRCCGLECRLANITQLASMMSQQASASTSEHLLLPAHGRGHERRAPHAARRRLPAGQRDGDRRQQRERRRPCDGRGAGEWRGCSGGCGLAPGGVGLAGGRAATASGVAARGALAAGASGRGGPRAGRCPAEGGRGLGGVSRFIRRRRRLAAGLGRGVS